MLFSTHLHPAQVLARCETEPAAHSLQPSFRLIRASRQVGFICHTARFRSILGVAL